MFDITSPPTVNLYDSLRNELIARTSVSKRKSNLNEETIGDSKSSQFLHHMQHLAGDITFDSIVRYIFLQRLLPTFHTAAVGEDIEKLARIAHNIANLNSTSIVSIFGIRNLESDPLVKNLESYQKLETELEEIAKRMHTFTSSCAFSSSRSSSRSMGINNDSPCYLHRKFGNKAYDCKSHYPCKLKERARAREKPKVIRCTSLGAVLSLLFSYERTTVIRFLVDSST